jgi:hypothetical protein
LCKPTLPFTEQISLELGREKYSVQYGDAGRPRDNRHAAVLDVEIRLSSGNQVNKCLAKRSAYRILLEKNVGCLAVDIRRDKCWMRGRSVASRLLWAKQTRKIAMRLSATPRRSRCHAYKGCTRLEESFLQEKF